MAYSGRLLESFGDCQPREFEFLPLVDQLTQRDVERQHSDVIARDRSHFSVDLRLPFSEPRERALDPGEFLACFA